MTLFSFDLKEDSEKYLNYFSDFLKINTISGSGAEGGYNRAVEYLSLLCKEAEADNVFILNESIKEKPILIATYEGSEPELSAILLNSHYDVVPIMESGWTLPAFEGIRKDGKIYGRGAQDMKCVCIQYIIAMKILKSQGFKPKRTIHLSFVPDEEIGGEEGMCILLQSQWYSNIKIAIALDEGLASEDDSYSVFYGERLPWWVRVRANGNTGHASRFIDGTAVEKIAKVINNALEFRELQRTLLHGANCHHNGSIGCSHSVVGKKKKTLGDVTTLNVTYIRAGIELGGKPVLNVVPATAEACFDIRISPHTPPQDIKMELDKWVKAQDNCSWEFINPGASSHAITSTDSSNPWWIVFSDVIENSLKIKLKQEVFPAATDSRFLRAIGIKAFGFSPMRNSPILLHEHDEYLEEKVFLEGCSVYVTLLSRLSTEDIKD